MRTVWLAAFSDLIPAEIGRSGDVDAACAFWDHLFADRLYEPVDLILLPECASRPRGMSGEAAVAFEERVYQPLVQTMQRLARRHQCYIAFPSLIPADKAGKRRNAVSLIDRQGELLLRYDKQALTQGELNAPRSMKGGGGPVIARCDFGTVGFFICFDINFPELMQAYMRLQPDVMLFASRCDGGFQRSLWAYLCRSHLLSAVGDGPCALLDPAGCPLAQSTNYRGYIRTRANLDCRNIGIGLTWQQLHDAQRRYPGKFHVEIPPYLSTGVAYSDDPNRGVDEYLEEAGIPTLDAYYNGMRRQYEALGQKQFLKP